MKKGVSVSWYRPSWMWFLSYLCLAALSGWVLVTTLPDNGWIGSNLVIQGVSLLVLGIASWGMFGSLFNRHRVIVNRHQLIRVTRPIRLFDRHVAYDRSKVFKLYLDERPGNFFMDYRVMVFLTGFRREVLFVTEDPGAAWYLQQVICGALRERRGEVELMRERMRTSTINEDKKKEEKVTLF